MPAGSRSTASWSSNLADLPNWRTLAGPLLLRVVHTLYSCQTMHELGRVDGATHAWEERWRERWPTTTWGWTLGLDIDVDKDIETYVLHKDFPGWRFFVTFSPSGVPVGFKVVGERMGDLKTGRLLPHAPDAPPVTARFLRRLPVGEIQQVARRGYLEATRRFPLRPDLPSHWEKVFADCPRPGRAGWRDADLAPVAAAYVDKVHSGTPRPTEELAREMVVSTSQLRNLLYLARCRGLLTAPQSGKAGGELTEKALTLLREDTD